jgi:hypothetical protein
MTRQRVANIMLKDIPWDNTELAAPLTLPGALLAPSYVEQAQIVKPANPPAGSMRFYPKSDGQYYKLDSAGTETIMGGLTLAQADARYLTKAQADGYYDVLGAATSAVTVHAAAADPHPIYLTQAEGDARYSAATNGLPVGGTVGQVLTKVNATDYNANWQTPTVGGVTMPLTQPITFSPDNIYDIGAIAANRPRSIYAATAFIGPGAIPTGGTTGQVLAKNTATNYDVGWAAAGTGGGGGSNSVAVYEVQGLTASTITLPVTPASILDVAVNGQSLMATRDYTVSNNVITFTTALTADDVHVEYMVSPFNYQAYSAHFETTLSVGQSVITLPTVVTGTPLVTRSGIVQYQSAGHFSISGVTLTLSAAIQASEDGRISVDYVAGGSAAPQAAVTEEFKPVAAATTVTLSKTPADVILVTRDGAVQSLTDAHYSFAGSVVTFTDAFNGSERVLVTYVVGAVGAVGAMGPSASLHEEFMPAASASTLTLSQVPQSILMVARNGVVQSASSGNYSFAGTVLTFTDTFSGTERVVVEYAVQTVVPPPSYNGAGITDQTIGNTKLSSDTARANLLTNGGFRIWQRGAGPFTTGYSADRWGVGGGGTGASHSVTQQSSTLGGAVSSVLQDVFTYGNAGASVYQILKMTDCDLRGRTITASAWMYCYQANAMRLNLASDGTSAQNIGSPCPIGVWTKLTVTIAVPTDATTVWFEMYMTASCNALMGQATLVIGSVPADYAPLHPADDLARCLRYYERVDAASNSYLCNAFCYAAANAMGFWYPKAPVKAVIPTVTASAPATWSVTNSGFGVVPATAFTPGMQAGGVALTIGVASGLVGGNASIVLANTGQSAFLVLEANP